MSKEIEFVKFWRIERAKGIKAFYKKYNKYIFITLIAFCIKVIVTITIYGVEINIIIEYIKIDIYIIIFPTTTWIYELNYKRLLNKH